MNRLAKLLNTARFMPMLVALRIANRLAARYPNLRPATEWGPGIAVLIPECGTPDLLAATLAQISTALGRIDEPTEIVVMVNGADPALYRELQQQFAGVTWLFAADALGFNGAVAAGLRAVHLPSVYLLNSDMRVAPDAILQLLPYRTPGVFALASQIYFADPQRRREETGWSDFYTEARRTVVYEKDPGNTQVARGSLYAGGGSSLFRTALLKDYVQGSQCYSPFYWEDADWGARAWAEGLECVFVPGSTAVHEHRGTIKRRFDAAEVDRVMERNALLFELRHHFTALDGLRAVGHLAGQPLATQRELCSVSIARGVVAVRAQSDAIKRRGFSYQTIVQKFYFPTWRANRPTVLWVTPFAIFPPAHGGARRIAELARRLAPHVNLILLSDEFNGYAGSVPEDFAVFQSAHLLQSRDDAAGQKLQELPIRMDVHAPRGLRYELRRLQQAHQVDLVQVEFMEATRLVEERLDAVPFIAMLHDVYLDGGAHDAFQQQVLRQYDAVVSCSGEDASLLAGLPHQVIANGAPDRMATSVASPDSKSILFMGPFRYAPNHAGILAFLEHAWPAIRAQHADATLVILGGGDAARPQYAHPLLAQPGVRLVSEFVDPEPYLAACALTINPQQDIRGSALKVAEALLARRLCVSTQAGARGFAAMAAAALRVVDGWPQMAAEINALLGDSERRHELENSAAEARHQLSWDGRAEELLQLYRALLPAKFTTMETNA